MNKFTDTCNEFKKNEEKTIEKTNIELLELFIKGVQIFFDF